MNSLARLSILGLLLWWAGCAQAQPSAPKEAQAREMELLRKTLAEQQKNPGQIIRTPQTLAFSTNAAVMASRAELERQYLDGKITAKQFQKALEQLQDEERRRALAAAKVSKPEANVPKSAPVAPPAAATTKPAPPPAAPAPATARPAATVAAPVTNAPAGELTPEQQKLSEVELRIEEMMRLKAAREKAATNAPASANAKAPAAPQTKRQRLDALLKQYIDGKLGDAEYNAQRTKIIAEPD